MSRWYARLCEAMLTPLDEYHAADEVQERRERLGWLVLAFVWVLVLLVAAGCEAPNDGDVAVSGLERSTTTRPSFTDEKPPPTTTTLPPTTTAAPTTTTTTAEVHIAAATPPRPVTTTVPARTGDCGGWEGLVAAYFPAEQVAKGCAVLMCESGGDPNAVSPTNDHGLWQINVVHSGSFDWSRRYDPEVNTAFARQLWGEQGWGPWSCA